MPFPEYGVELYGNVIVARDEFLEENPEAVSGFLRAFTRALEDTLADPESAVEYVYQRDQLIDRDVELERLKLAIDGSIATDFTRENGVGDVDMDRLSASIDQVADAFDLQDNLPSAEEVFTREFLPDQEMRMVFPE